MGMPTLAGPEAAGKICPLCRTAIQAGAAINTCPACKNPHHANCWQQRGGCGVYGCSQAAAPQATVQQPAAAGPKACPKCGYVYGPMETTCRRCAASERQVAVARRPTVERKSPITTMVAVLVALAIVAAGVVYLTQRPYEGTVKLEYRFKPGQVDKYDLKVDMSMDVPRGIFGGGKIDFDITAAIIQKVLSVDAAKGTARLSATIRDAKLSSTMLPSGMVPPIPDETKEYTVDKLGRMLGAEGAAQSVSALAMAGPNSNPLQAMGLAGTLPARGVDIGETWTESVPVGKSSIQITSKLVTDNEMVGKRRCCKIDQRYDGKMNLADLPDAQDNPQLRNASGSIQVDGSGTVYFAQDEGKMVKTDQKVKMSVHMEGGGPLGGTMDMTMDLGILASLLD